MCNVCRIPLTDKTADNLYQLLCLAVADEFRIIYTLSQESNIIYFNPMWTA